MCQKYYNLGRGLALWPKLLIQGPKFHIFGRTLVCQHVSPVFEEVRKKKFLKSWSFLHIWSCPRVPEGCLILKNITNIYSSLFDTNKWYQMVIQFTRSKKYKIINGRRMMDVARRMTTDED